VYPTVDWRCGMTSADALNPNCYGLTFSPRRQPGHPADEGNPELSALDVPDRLLADLILDRCLLFSSTAVWCRVFRAGLAL
jgi:hypothetical protein